MEKTKNLKRFVIVLVIALALSACGKGKERIDVQEDMTSAIGVNGYLWRASLDSLEALPIAQTDSAGGIIISDWFSDPAAKEAQGRFQKILRGADSTIDERNERRLTPFRFLKPSNVLNSISI